MSEPKIEPATDEIVKQWEDDLNEYSYVEDRISSDDLRAIIARLRAAEHLVKGQAELIRHWTDKAIELEQKLETAEEFRARAQERLQHHWLEFETMKAKSEERRKLLEELQFCRSDAIGYPMCPACEGSISDMNHKDNCRIAAAIKETS